MAPESFRIFLTNYSLASPGDRPRDLAPAVRGTPQTRLIFDKIMAKHIFLPAVSG